MWLLRERLIDFREIIWQSKSQTTQFYIKFIVGTLSIDNETDDDDAS